MYITLNLTSYDYIVDNNQIPCNLPKPDFMPTELVRISDMAVVNGSDVNEGYCALSYSWNQSGEILRDEATGEYKRIDEGKHVIISRNKIRKNNYCFTKTTKYVKFEGIIQKICQHFNIKYIWYDQMCINQDDKEEKQSEIRNMHRIYSNAYCTVALVPECNNGVLSLGINGEEYFKRLWTLEEAIKSERLLFVGFCEHIWGEQLKTSMATGILNRPLSKISVSQILQQAHQRTSTKEHDRVFALIHLFPEFMQHINIDYDQPFEDLMIRFYGLLAKKDISILLFENKRYYNSTIQKYKFLPSWTGIDGKHITYDVTTSFRNYDIIGKTMHVTSKFFRNGQPIDNDALTIRKEDLPPPPGDINDGDNIECYYLCTPVQLSGSSETRFVSLLYDFNNIVNNEKCFKVISKKLKRLSRFIISKKLKRLSRFMETNKKNLYWCHSKREEYQKVIKINFGSLTEDVDDLSAQYFILSEVLFKDTFGILRYPVIKRKQGEEYYKAIGCLKIECKEDIFSNSNLPKQTFLIQ